MTNDEVNSNRRSRFTKSQTDALNDMYKVRQGKRYSREELQKIGENLDLSWYQNKRAREKKKKTKENESEKVGQVQPAAFNMNVGMNMFPQEIFFMNPGVGLVPVYQCIPGMGAVAPNDASEMSPNATNDDGDAKTTVPTSRAQYQADMADDSDAGGANSGSGHKDRAFAAMLAVASTPVFAQPAFNMNVMSTTTPAEETNTVQPNDCNINNDVAAVGSANLIEVQDHGSNIALLTELAAAEYENLSAKNDNSRNCRSRSHSGSGTKFRSGDASVDCTPTKLSRDDDDVPSPTTNMPLNDESKVEQDQDDNKSNDEMMEVRKQYVSSFNPAYGGMMMYPVHMAQMSLPGVRYQVNQFDTRFASLMPLSMVQPLPADR